MIWKMNSLGVIGAVLVMCLTCHAASIAPAATCSSNYADGSSDGVCGGFADPVGAGGTADTQPLLINANVFAASYADDWTIDSTAHASWQYTFTVPGDYPTALTLTTDSDGSSQISVYADVQWAGNDYSCFGPICTKILNVVLPANTPITVSLDAFSQTYGGLFGPGSSGGVAGVSMAVDPPAAQAPEPAAMAMLALGLVGLMGLRWTGDRLSKARSN